jgi:hypothetical protein
MYMLLPAIRIEHLAKRKHGGALKEAVLVGRRGPPACKIYKAKMTISSSLLTRLSARCYNPACPFAPMLQSFPTFTAR